MARVIAVASMKGGSGKSTIAMVLSELLALGDPARPPRRVLCIDLDPQASLTVMLKGAGYISSLDDAKSINALIGKLKDDKPITSALNYINSPASNLRFGSIGEGGPIGRVDLIPAKHGTRFDEMRLEFSAFREGSSGGEARSIVSRRLAAFLAIVGKDYEDIVIDCPPSLTLLAQAALSIADIMVSPIVPEHASYWSALEFLREIVKADEEHPAFINPKNIAVVINKTRPFGSHLKSQEAISQSLSKSKIRLIREKIPLADSLTKAAQRGGTAGPPISANEKYGRELQRLRQVATAIHNFHQPME